MSDLRFGRFRLWWILLPGLAALLLAAYSLGWRPSLIARDVLPPIVYIGYDSNGRPQLFRAEVRGANTTTTQLTAIQDATLLDFAVSPQRFPIAFSVETATGGGIWLLPEAGGEFTRLLDCPQAECSSPVWSPDGRRLVYERRGLNEGDGVAGRPYLWWLDTVTGETIPVLENNHSSAQNARFSLDGEWLSYAVPAEEGVEVYNLEDGRHFLLPSQIGAAVAWSHDSQWMIISDLELITYHGDDGEDHLGHSHEYEEAIQLYLVDMGDVGAAGDGTFDGERIRLSPQVGVDDGLAAWSPDGAWIAFSRKPPRTQSGRQLWLMRPDGSDARALTDDPAIQHGQPHWSPDGHYLLFQRFAALEPGAVPEIWLLNVESGEMQQVVDGFLPDWLY